MHVQLNKRAVLLHVLLLIAGLSFAACNFPKKDTQSEQKGHTMKQITSISQQSYTDVSFTDENGKIISLKSLKGKVVFINFWATWCPPCIHEMPSINELKKAFNGNNNIVFLMVDVDNNIKKSKAFMKNRKFDLPVYTPASDIPKEYLGRSIPATVILDKNGVMAGRVEGSRDYTDPKMIKALKELVGE